MGPLAAAGPTVTKLAARALEAVAVASASDETSQANATRANAADPNAARPNAARPNAARPNAAGPSLMGARLLTRSAWATARTRAAGDLSRRPAPRSQRGPGRGCRGREA